MPRVDEFPSYSVGDLVKLYSGHTYYWEWYGHDEDPAETYGIVIGRSESWYQSYKESRKSDDGEGTRYWDNVNYTPYKVMTIEGRIEWVSPEHMKFIS